VAFRENDLCALRCALAGDSKNTILSLTGRARWFFDHPITRFFQYPALRANQNRAGPGTRAFREG
jgi:hypothetical protein